MPPRVFLTAVQGPLSGTKYRFDEPMLCLAGRSSGCILQLTGEAGKGVSRHHCLLDVRPPAAFLSDLNSRNGTFVNGERLGRGNGENNAPGSAGTGGVNRRLEDGDQIRIGCNLFNVSLVEALHCRVCGRELPDPAAEDSCVEGIPGSQRMVCADCLAQGRAIPVRPSAKTVLFPVCSVCGARIATHENGRQDGEMWEENASAFICHACLANRKPAPGKTFRMPALAMRKRSGLFELPGYRVLKRIGRGGMGAVYLAESLETLEKVALKVLLPEIAVHEQCREDFVREAENLKQLRHPNIVELKGCAQSPSALFLALEFCSEGTLREFMRRAGGPLPLQTALDITRQVLDALDYAHNVRLAQHSLLDAGTYIVNGLVHRDIKPSNIFLTRQDGVLFAKIADFGIAKAFDMAGLSGCTRTGDFSGSLGFIPKQQFLNYKYVKPEVDVWAAAATLYYMLTGKAPRDFFSTRSAARAFDSPPEKIRERNPEVPKTVADVLDTALDDRKTLHFKSASQLAFALREAVNRPE